MPWYRRRHVLLLTVVLLCPGASAAINGQSRSLSTRGKEFISPEGKRLLLKGINLGNWLLPEGYMFKFKTASSPRLIQTVVNELVGEDEGRRFWKRSEERRVGKECRSRWSP